MAECPHEAQTDAVRSAEKGVVNAARRFSDCAAEFEGDLGCCGEKLDDLWSAVDRLRDVEGRAPLTA